MRNRPPNLSTVGGVDRQTDISNERLRTISCIGVKQIPQKVERLVMGSLGSHNTTLYLTHRPSNKLIPCWLTTTARLRIRQPQCKFLPTGGGLTLSNNPPNTSQKPPPTTPTPQQQTTPPQNTQKNHYTNNPNH